MSKAPQLHFLQAAGFDRLIVLVHGIRQDRTGVMALANRIAAASPKSAVAIFDYDWTQAIASSGKQLAAKLASMPHARIDIVGYSMGGLVARRAVADTFVNTVNTVVTLASPNRGAVTPGMLGAFGQTLRECARFISPYARCEGLLDLTDFNETMTQHQRTPAVRAAIKGRRYASIPALYFYQDRPWRSLKSPMGAPAMALSLITRMARPHDGIVCEERNDVTSRGSTDFAEFHLAEGDGKTPARCHAPHIAARDLDHMSVLESSEIADLIVRIIDTTDWAAMPPDPDLRFHYS